MPKTPGGDRNRSDDSGVTSWAEPEEDPSQTNYLAENQSARRHRHRQEDGPRTSVPQNRLLLGLKTVGTAVPRIRRVARAA